MHELRARNNFRQYLVRFKKFDLVYIPLRPVFSLKMYLWVLNRQARTLCIL